MKPYTAIPACRGQSCNQGRAQCKSEAMCRIDLHRVTTTDGGKTITDGAMDDDVSVYGAATIWAALALVALVAAAVSMDSIASYVVASWPRLVAMLS